MTSGTCQLGEPQPKINYQQAARAVQTFGRQEQQFADGRQHHSALGNTPNSVSQGTDLEANTGASVVTNSTAWNGNQKRASSGSSDSGQLSLLSSFGSLSLGGYQQIESIEPQTSTSNDSTCGQSMSTIDIDQHRFYCSLMLLNSLDFGLPEHQKDSHQRQAKKEAQQINSSLSSSDLRKSKLNIAATCRKSLQDCRARWFVDTSNHQAVGDKLVGLVGENTKSQPLLQKAKFSIVDSIKRQETTATSTSETCDKATREKRKKKGSLGVLGAGGWRYQGAGKLVAAASVATNSVGFVDKLLTHMVKKSSSNHVNRSVGPLSGDKSVKSAKQATMNGSGGEDGKESSKNAHVEAGPKKQKANQSGSSSIHLLTDWSQRLVRRCGGGSRSGSGGKAAQFDCARKGKAASSAARGSGSEQQAKGESKWRLMSQKEVGIETVSQARAKSSEPQVGMFNMIELGRSQLCDGGNADTAADMGRLQRSIPVLAATASNQSKVDSANTLVEDQIRLQQACSNSASSSNSNNNNGEGGIANCELTNSAHLYASISTLNTAPSNCCFCDNETCSSSGFVSSSIGCGASSGEGGGIESGCANSAGISGVNIGSGGGDIGRACGGGDSTTTHSCNSSTNNELISTISPPSTNDFSASPQANHTNSTNSHQPSGSHQFQESTSCLPQHDKYPERSHQESHLCDLHHQKQQQSSSIGNCLHGIELGANNKIDPGMIAHDPIMPMTADRIGLDQNTALTVINVELFGDQPQPLSIGRSMTEVQAIERKKEQQQSAHEVKVPKEDTGLLKPRASLLSRARNSTINLASLATVTNRFSCSASVGNLWHHGQHHSNQNELADDSAADGIQPIDYTTTGAFDSYPPDNSDDKLPAKEPKSMKTASSHKLLGVAALGSARKLSTKEKCKRQKDAERIEKLRLLVSYLKSGSSQPVVSPVALEADEIELAERYKLHMILRDDLLNDSQTGDQNQPSAVQQQQGNQLSPENNTGALASKAEHKQLDECIGGKNRMISHSIGGTTASSPASSSSGSMNHAHSTNDGRSIPHIGNVTWVLRHSISDPGNNFEHSPAFSSLSSSHNHPPRDNNHHHHHNHHNRPNGSENISHSHPFSRPAIHNQSECVNCESCAPSSSYSGISLNDYCSAPTINKEAMKLPTSSQHTKSPKLFYIDDMDHIPTVAAPNGPLLAPLTPVINTTCAHFPMPLASTPTPSSSSSANALEPTPITCCSQPVTPAISTTNSSIKNSSSASTSAWSNAPNLATWIDNEVNSLVHDLETKSQQLSNKGEDKPAKSGKKKWLSVTSGNTRRNSSGAHST